MFKKDVIATMIIDGEEVQISISIGCVPETPDKELIRRAGNILRQAANNATYTVR